MGVVVRYVAVRYVVTFGCSDDVAIITVYVRVRSHGVVLPLLLLIVMRWLLPGVFGDCIVFVVATVCEYGNAAVVGFGCVIVAVCYAVKGVGVNVFICVVVAVVCCY